MPDIGTPGPLTAEQLGLMQFWWRAANYLSVGQVYLLDNPLLREDLQPKHIKPRLLGHWGTDDRAELSSTSILTASLKKRDLNAIYHLPAPATARPGMVANTYLEGTYSEVYPRYPTRCQAG